MVLTTAKRESEAARAPKTTKLRQKGKAIAIAEWRSTHMPLHHLLLRFEYVSITIIDQLISLKTS